MVASLFQLDIPKRFHSFCHNQVTFFDDKTEYLSLLSRLLITERKLTHSDPNKYENLPGEDGADVERLDPAAAAAIL